MPEKTIHVPGEPIGKDGLIFHSYIDGVYAPAEGKANATCGLCGTVFLGKIGDMRSGTIRSCGCMKKAKVYEVGTIIGDNEIVFNGYDGVVANSGVKVNFICHCGKEFKCQLNYIKDNHTKSCGCRKNKGTHGLAKRDGKHGYYNIWCGMMKRCYNPSDSSYKNYGGRGILICEEWKDVNVFNSYMVENFGERDGDLTIDRIDVNGNYEPGNVRMTDWITQGRNRRNNIIEEFNGKEMTLSEISEITGLNKATISKRRQRGMSGDELAADKMVNKIMIHGEYLTLREIEAKYNVPYVRLRSRMYKGVTGEALIEPVKRNRQDNLDNKKTPSL